MEEPPWKTHRDKFKFQTDLGEDKKCLGKGCFGSVWKAEGEFTKLYAIKQVFIDKTIRHFNGDKTKLFNEVKILIQIDHKNVVRYYSYWVEGPDEEFITLNSNNEIEYNPPPVERSSSSMEPPEKNFLFIQMELCDFTLDYCLKNLSKDDCKWIQTLRNVLDIFIQLTKGLSYLRRKNIIHCDLKPNNILATRDQGEDEYNKISWKIGDFGLSKKKPNEPNQKTSLADPSIHGCEQYQAPEIKKTGNTFESDVFTLGIIFHRVLDIIYSGSLVGSIPPEIHQAKLIIIKMINPLPNERPKAHELYKQFKRINSPSKISEEETTERLNIEDGNAQEPLITVGRENSDLVTNKKRLIYYIGFDIVLSLAIILLSFLWNYLATTEMENLYFPKINTPMLYVPDILSILLFSILCYGLSQSKEKWIFWSFCFSSVVFIGRIPVYSGCLILTYTTSRNFPFVLFGILFVRFLYNIICLVKVNQIIK